MNKTNLNAQKMIHAALQAVDPYTLVKDHISLNGNILTVEDKKRFDLSRFKNIYILGAGKGAAPMAKAIEELLGDRIAEGFVSVKYGYGQNLKMIDIYESGHPLPDNNSLFAGRRVLEIADKAGKDDLAIVLISGGGSSLLEALVPSITLEDLTALNQSLLACGASIEEINTLRKELSLIKGGRLAHRIHPAQTLGLILSDIIGDPLSMIASGPTVIAEDDDISPDLILRKYDLFKKIPEKIVRILEKKSQKSANTVVKVDNFIIGNNLRALQAAEKVAAECGYRTLILSDRIEGESREVAKVFTAIIDSVQNNNLPYAPPFCLLAGGETTVTLNGTGKGGRNQETVLSALTALRKDKKPFYFCSIGTDGSDGPTDAAGAWIDESSFDKAYNLDLNAVKYLKNNDSYHFFNKLGQLIKTCPTKTNVMDIMIIMIDGE